MLAQVLLPLLECGLLYASLAADRGEPPRLRHLIAIAAAPPRALAAVVAASLVIFAVESIVAQAFGDINLLAPAERRRIDVGRRARRDLRRRHPRVAAASCSCRSSRCSTAPGFATAFAQSVAAFTRNRRAAAAVRRAVVRAADARPRDERRRAAARVAVVRRGVVRGVEGDFQRRVTATRVGAFLHESGRSSATGEKLQW